MRNLAISPDAAFHQAYRWSAGDLPITLHWRSSLWRYIVPLLWSFGLLVWIGMFGTETPHWGVVVYALIFIAMPGVLAASAAWWVIQLRNGRHAGSFVIHDDFLEWQFEDTAEADRFADCGRFEIVGKRGYDAHIEWDLTGHGRDDAAGWRDVARRILPAGWVAADRTLYARDVGLDHADLDSLCKLLNQLRDEAASHA